MESCQFMRKFDLERMLQRSLIASWAVLALAAVPQEKVSDAPPPSPIEQALMEHVCGGRPTGEAAIYQACLNGQLQSLRGDFGIDLKGLAPAERKALDSGCTPLRMDREAYVRCLSDQLIALRNRRNRSRQPASTEIQRPSPADADVQATTVATPVVTQAVSQPSSQSAVLWFGAIVATLVVAGGGALLVRKPRARETPKTLKCRVCGNPPESGDLCQQCRHEAAEAVRRAAAERADEQRARERASEEEERHQNAVAEAARLQRIRHEEAARLQQEEQARQQELARQEEERRQGEEEARTRRQSADAPDDEFDPHDVLGVPKGASLEAIRAAHEEARTKYDPKLAVDFGGAELQAYFEAKTRAVDRAFELLTK
jgi:hypothetical protein